MGKLLEVIRRLAVALVWLFGGGFAFLVVNKFWEDSSSTRELEDLYPAAISIIVSYVIHRVINWILLRDDELFEDD